MARLIKAYNEGEDMLFEVGVKAFTEHGAKVRGTSWLLGRFPDHITALEDIQVVTFKKGMRPKEYSVMIRLDSRADVRSIIVPDSVQELFDRGVL